MSKLLLPLCLLLVASLSTSAVAESQPIRALLIAGGCCHDYEGQHKVLADGIQARANVQVDVYWTDDKSVNPPFPLYDKKDWAEGYDVIIHDECAAGNEDVAVMNRILEVHKTIPAVHLHCAMHSFRNGTDLWFKHLGLTSRSHGPKLPIDIKFVDGEHPITKGMNDWTTDNEELYNNLEVYGAKPLAMGHQMVKGKEMKAIVAWTNEETGAKSFSTTIGHYTETVADDRYLDLVTRGLLWSCDKLEPEYQKPFKGENKTTFIPSKPAAPKKPKNPKKGNPKPASN